MSKLNKDILFLLFEELRDDSKSLFSCLMVNRLWCETVVPVLWENPWNYNINYYHNHSALYYVITFYLPDDIKEFLTSLGIQFPPILYPSLLFDYLSLCRSINMNVINIIISAGSPSAYNQFLFQQEIYSLFIRKCPEFKYLDMRSIKHQIFYFPEAKIHLNSICELTCEKSIDPSYFYGLACICRNIQSLIIINADANSNHGIVKLIEVQKNLKYFEWQDSSYWDDYSIVDPYEDILLAIAEKADTLNHFVLAFLDIDEFNYTILQMVLQKLCKLKTLKLSPLYLNDYNFDELLKLSVYLDLEVFKVDIIKLNSVTRIIENSRGRLREISAAYDSLSENSFNEDSLNLINTIYEKCPLIERLSLKFPLTENHLIEFEKLLKGCQKLKVLLLNLISDEVDGSELLRILNRSAPTNLREIRFFNYTFSLETLEEFLEKWRGRHSLSILTCNAIYNGHDYLNLINKYKNDGVIEDFRFVIRDDILF